MVLVVESPSRIGLTPSPAPSGGGCGSSAHVESDSRPSTPKRMIQSLMGGRHSPFRVTSAVASGGSGFLSRSGSSSCRSSSKERRGKRNSQILDTPALTVDTVAKPKPVKMSPFPQALSSPMLTQFESKDETLGSPMIIIQSLSSSETQMPQHSGVTSPAEVISGSTSTTSTTSTLSVETDDEDLISTRSPSPFEDMMDSQVTASTIDTVSEDLPEGLRLMRVAQRHGIKVRDFAFEGAKHEGQVEDWAWEGGAACKGFGMGFGGGAYNGALKKYRPPPKEREEEEEDDDAMVIDSPPKSKPTNNIFTPAAKPTAHRPPPIFSNVRPGNVERPFNSPGLPGLPRPVSGVSGSDFLRYLEERRANQAAMATATTTGLAAPPSGGTDATGIKRDRSFGSSEPRPEERSPFKKRVLG